jgi:hypothetical protein
MRISVLGFPKVVHVGFALLIFSGSEAQGSETVLLIESPGAYIALESHESNTEQYVEG